MGAGIALVSARGGFETVCFDTSAEGLARSSQGDRDFLR